MSQASRPATASVSPPAAHAVGGTPQAAAASAAPVSGGSAGQPSGAAAPPRVQVGEAVRSARQTVSAAASRGPRRARLQLKKVDPWSVMKFSFAVSLVLFIASVVATSILYMVLGALGVWDSLNDTISTVTAGQDGSQGVDLAITAKMVIGGSALLGAVNMVLFTALATLGAFIYNVCADLVGGVELTLAERNQ
ncbi:DUF3566 domain-containing protein [Cryptosporangium aurantiacum]|uniref:DUF3566 domain-containing protein n=1 Tax=Cryptosporangium aurantiacum TaxID=134849 RepID=UPI001C4A14D6|nr:DUF3566 domain-containing protein [Cryptosporangium aurantiacum]